MWHFIYHQDRHVLPVCSGSVIERLRVPYTNRSNVTHTLSQQKVEAWYPEEPNIAVRSALTIGFAKRPKYLRFFYPSIQHIDLKLSSFDRARDINVDADT
ncbi:uncharacterized protein PHALS_06621 [Plasmopara halstedii]|uniref:Uncharacterized protein n=1 Tax=Plasmopara halstedii TaxID=4781 RepID=A0A0P1B3X7_PLAHL|nr:uncharacterized protein PHALS_06621 [Plasmopara halstedii]CEG48821.1 hypothetical protein PHALS_06621 [Plasmopara halstedii]|eukprot:XP_024585190.1 hypothetical protein PHALS_06621 [Plasmopara halstedii]